MLGSTIHGMIEGIGTYDRARHVAELNALPGTWELARELSDV